MLKNYGLSMPSVIVYKNYGLWIRG